MKTHISGMLIINPMGALESYIIKVLDVLVTSKQIKFDEIPQSSSVCNADVGALGSRRCEIAI